jgi:glycine/D-amino acid oxidase-like deaminating enzyme
LTSEHHHSLHSATRHFDAVVIGGGFYGCCLALHLRRNLAMTNVAIVERGAALLTRASYGNQARVHGGYHYPRDFTTAWRSRANFALFTSRYRAAVDDTFVKLYAIARRNSHVTATQFARAMEAMGAPCTPALRRHRALFSPSLVEAVFETQEYAFDAGRLAAMLADDLEDAGVVVLLDTEASVASRSAEAVDIELHDQQGLMDHLRATVVVNCTYGRIGHVGGIAPPAAGVRYQVAELCLVEPPAELRGIGVTVMDGPFFSCMPFPARGLHSLSHVRYTPQVSWTSSEHPDRDPYAFLDAWPRHTGFSMMVRDAARMMPIMADAVHRDSIYEIKAILAANHADDGRPILVEGDLAPGGVVSVLGGKLDNIFDVQAVLDSWKETTS